DFLHPASRSILSKSRVCPAVPSTKHRRYAEFSFIFGDFISLGSEPNARMAGFLLQTPKKARGVPKSKGEARMKTTLCVTTAAAAPIAGSTFAGAQTGGTGGASPGSSQMSQGQGATQKGAASEQKGAKPGMAQGKEERTEKKGLEGKEQRSKASDKAQSPKTEQQGKQPGMAQGMAQEKGGEPTGQSTTGQQKPSTQTQTQGTSKGTTSQGTTSQGTTSQSTTSSSGSVQLSQEQRTKVHSIVVKESSARVENVSFS